MITIDTGINEQQFADILARGALETYDPARHLLPRVAALTWKIDPKSAAERLRRHAAEWGLEEVRVLNPQTGHEVLVFRRVEGCA